jgi:hypothetical protein
MNRQMAKVSETSETCKNQCLGLRNITAIGFRDFRDELPGRAVYLVSQCCIGAKVAPVRMSHGSRHRGPLWLLPSAASKRALIGAFLLDG